MDISNIFHEKQEQGSMLCAQHALNNLLQTSLYSASELANIAHNLDEMEAQATQGEIEKNQNADDTGFFSVAVLEQALSFVNLRLVRWDSRDMRAMHDYPEMQSAFVLNLAQHWFTMRRFGNNPDIWFNLNSFLPQPERVSKLYLGMQIHQAQREGYSVFAVLPADSDFNPDQSFLPLAPADEMFASNPHLAFAGFSNGPVPLSSASGSGSSNGSKRRSQSIDSGEDERPARRQRISPEDEEAEMLRRAIEASLQEQHASSSKPAQPREVSDNEEERLAQNLHNNARLDTGSSTPALETGDNEFEEDAPSIDELRLKRLARFGGQ